MRGDIFSSTLTSASVRNLAKPVRTCLSTSFLVVNMVSLIGWAFGGCASLWVEGSADKRTGHTRAAQQCDSISVEQVCVLAGTRSTGVARDVVWGGLGWGGQQPTMCGRNSQDTNKHTDGTREETSNGVCVCLGVCGAKFFCVFACFIRACSNLYHTCTHAQIR